MSTKLLALSIIRDAGSAGISSRQIYARMPKAPLSTRQSALHHLRDAGCVCVHRYSLFTVYFDSSVPMVDQRAAFDELVRRYIVQQENGTRAWRQKGNAQARARNAERREARRLLAQADAEARKAQRAEDAKRRAELKAAKKAEGAANNLLAERIKNDGTYKVPTVSTLKAPEPVVTMADGVRITVQKAPPYRWARTAPEPLFSSLPSGVYESEATSCAARAVAS